MLHDDYKDTGYNVTTDDSWDEPSFGSWIVAGVVIVLTVILIVFWPGTVKADEASAEEYSAMEICDSIYRAEGGAKAQYYYGIRSVKYDNLAEAQRICLNTVRNNKRRYALAGSKGEFLQFLANRYCPIGADNDPKGLNKNWLKNVKFYLEKNNE